MCSRDCLRTHCVHTTLCQASSSLQVCHELEPFVWCHSSSPQKLERSLRMRLQERRAAETAAAADELEAEGEVPDDFLDPLLQTVMRDPVTLPDSRITIDRSTIERHLLGSKTDPFNRSPLTVEALQPNDELRARIQEWQRQRSASKAARTTG